MLSSNRCNAMLRLQKWKYKTPGSDKCLDNMLIHWTRIKATSIQTKKMSLHCRWQLNARYFLVFAFYEVCWTTPSIESLCQRSLMVRRVLQAWQQRQTAVRGRWGQERTAWIPLWDSSSPLEPHKGSTPPEETHKELMQSHWENVMFPLKIIFI